MARLGGNAGKRRRLRGAPPDDHAPWVGSHEGHRGSYLVRRDVDEGVEFATLTLWESLDAVKAFAGEDYEVAVVPDPARAVLSRWDERSVHYEVAVSPTG